MLHSGSSVLLRRCGASVVARARQHAQHRLAANRSSSTRHQLPSTGLDLLSSATSARPRQQQPDQPEASTSYQAPDPTKWGEDALLMSGCEPGKQLRVAVLLSGGVDSSLALRLLRAAGHQCRAFYLKIWFQEDFRNYWDACPWEEDLSYAQQVCEGLGVELEVVPMTEQYWAHVVAECVTEIRAGRTPNPDILCNSHVKFGAFFAHLEARHGGEFDRVASGHYARVLRQQPGGDDAPAAGAGGGSVQLALTPDAVKDQTYFLAGLSQRQLQRALFPLGPLTKAQVRQLAAAARLATQARKDSQGICFLGKVKFNEFVKEHLGEWQGPIVEDETGQAVGVHQGFWFYTVGQRGGIGLPGGPWYVSRKDPEMNVVYVSRNYYEAGHSRNTFICGPFNWCSATPLRPGSQVWVKVRHGPNMYRCTLAVHDGGEAGTVVLEANDQGLAAGQYAVFYQEGVCLGAAKIRECVTEG